MRVRIGDLLGYILATAHVKEVRWMLNEGTGYSDMTMTIRGTSTKNHVCIALFAKVCLCGCHQNCFFYLHSVYA